MNRSRFIVSVVVFAGLLSCNSDPSREKRVEEVPVDSPISAIIRNPATANQPLDTVNVAKLTFEYEEFDFGSVKEGEEVTHHFRFRNTGKVPLLITDARSSCGCTVPTWPREPVAPGQGGEIKVVFNTLNKSGQQRKEVAITANTYPAQNTVFLSGKVTASQQQ